MPYGLILFAASIILSGLYLFTDAALWSKILVGGICLLSLACFSGVLPFPLFGLLLRVGLCIFIPLYLKANS